MNCYVDIHTHHPTGQHIEPKGVGIHPWYAERYATCELSLGDEVTTAELIGEIGLDFACGVDRQLQEQVFRQQLLIAERLQKPVVLHCVRAFEPMMNILSEHKLRAVIFHGFIGSAEQAQRALDRGYFLSFGVNVLRSPKSIKALNICPLERMFVESDESLIPIAEIYAEIARLRGVDVAVLAAKTEENYKRIFDR